MDFPTTVTPTLPLLGLDEDEKNLIRTLQSQYQRHRADMELAEAYYLGMQGRG